MITLATDRYSGLQQLAQAVVSALVSVERSREPLASASAVASADATAVTDMATRMATEDWDLLFRAVLARLVSTFAEGDEQANRARTTVLECVQALDQLRTTAGQV